MEILIVIIEEKYVIDELKEILIGYSKDDEMCDTHIITNLFKSIYNTFATYPDISFIEIINDSIYLTLSTYSIECICYSVDLRDKQEHKINTWFNKYSNPDYNFVTLVDMLGE